MLAAKRYVLAALVAALPVLAGCEHPAPTSVEPAPVAAATSVMNPTTGEPVAINYPANPVFVDALAGSTPLTTAAEFGPIEPCDPTYEYCGPCDPINDYGCEPCPRDNPSAWCYEPPCVAGVISSSVTRRAGDDPYAGLEANILPGTSCNRQVMTGIGARIDNSDNVTTLHVQTRTVDANAALGSPVIYRAGSDPYHALEAWAEVPAGYGIVGVAVGQGGYHNLQTLIIYYRQVQLTGAGVRMTGPVYSLNTGYNPYGGTDASVITYADNEVYVGAGFRSASSKVRTMAAHIGIIP